MKAKDIRELSGDERSQKLQELRKERFDLMKLKVTGKVENPLRLRHLRRDIARVQTVLQQTKQQGV